MKASGRPRVFDRPEKEWPRLQLDSAPEANTDDASLIAYWTKLGFVRRQDDDAFYDTETMFEQP